MPRRRPDGDSSRPRARRPGESTSRRRTKPQAGQVASGRRSRRRPGEDDSSGPQARRPFQPRGRDRNAGARSAGRDATAGARSRGERARGSRTNPRRPSTETARPKPSRRRPERRAGPPAREPTRHPLRAAVMGGRSASPQTPGDVAEWFEARDPAGPFDADLLLRHAEWASLVPSIERAGADVSSALPRLAADIASVLSWNRTVSNLISRS